MTAVTNGMADDLGQLFHSCHHFLLSDYCQINLLLSSVGCSTTRIEFYTYAWMKKAEKIPLCLLRGVIGTAQPLYNRKCHLK